MRQTTGSVVCPECGRLVEVHEKNCPYCGRWQPAMFGYSRTLQAIFGNLDVSQGILWSCVILYVLSLVLDVGGMMSNMRGGLFGILSPSGKALYQLGMTGGATMRLGTDWYTTLSATFLHGSLLHIFFNMMWLRMLAPLVEKTLGPGRFFVLYSLSGVAGYAVSNQLSGAPTVGASGAIFGLLAASIVIGRHEGGAWGRAISQQAITWAALLFVMGLLYSMTNNYAHAGGFIGGWVLGSYFVKTAHRAEGPATQATAGLLAVGTLVVIVLSFIKVSRLV